MLYENTNLRLFKCDMVNVSNIQANMASSNRRFVSAVAKLQAYLSQISVTFLNTLAIFTCNIEFL